MHLFDIPSQYAPSLNAPSATHPFKTIFSGMMTFVMSRGLRLSHWRWRYARYKRGTSNNSITTNQTPLMYIDVPKLTYFDLFC